MTMRAHLHPSPLLRLSLSHPPRHHPIAPFSRLTPPSSLRQITPTRALHLTPTSPLSAQESYGNSSNPAPSPNAGSPSESNPSSEETQGREHPGPKSPADGGGAKTEHAEKKGGGGKTATGAQPKILSEADDEMGAGKGEGQRKGEEVKRHNEEMDKRHDRPQEKEGQEGDRVGKGFWKGQGGADRDP